MKGLKKLLGLLVAAFMVFGLMAPAYAEAVQRTTAVTIHKIEMTNFEGFPKANPNAGVITNLEGWFGTGAKEIAGVKFNYYKIEMSSQYYDDEDEDLVIVPENILKVATGVVDKGSFVTTETGYTLNLPDGRYVFYEDEENGLIRDSLAVPFVLNLPTAQRKDNGDIDYNSDGSVKYLTSMHIYPKNITEKPLPKKFVRAVDNLVDSQKVGDLVHYILTTSIPKNIERYDQFNFVDVLDSRLSYAGNLKVTLNETALVKGTGTFDFNASGVEYFATEPTEVKGGTLTVQFTQAGLNKIGEGDGTDKKLMVEYDVKINEDAATWYTEASEDDEIANSFDIKYINTFNTTGGPGTEKTETSNKVYVYVGGKTFIKTNDYAKNDDLVQFLPGAEFALFLNDEAKTPVNWTLELIAMNGADTTKFGGTVAVGEQIVLKSGANGTFEIKGLKAVVDGFSGVYLLEETKAPDGYVKLNSEITFTVTKSGYDTDNPKQIRNAKKPSIPQTGGIGTIIFLAAGLTLMGAAVVALRRKSQSDK